MKQTELTFYGEPDLKESLLAYTKRHQEADAYIRGSWLNGETAKNGSKKGCFYGCMTQQNENTLEAAAKQYGLPLWYVHVTEKIYEGLPENEWLKFPFQAIEVLPVGVDTNQLRSLFQYKLLEDQLRFSNGNKQVEEAIKQCMELFRLPFNEIEGSAARSAARSAWSAAWSAAESAWSAAESARSAESAWSAVRSARSAESAAESAARSAWSARSARSAVRSARSARSAARSARSEYYSFQRDLLFQCIKELFESPSSVKSHGYKLKVIE